MLKTVFNDVMRKKHPSDWFSQLKCGETSVENSLCSVIPPKFAQAMHEESSQSKNGPTSSQGP
jgi:hypothetical protein